jgi:hypothetical protein
VKRQSPSQQPRRLLNRARLGRLAILLLVLCPFAARSQDKGDPLNDAEVDQVRETGDDPIERVKLYMKFIEQRTAAINEMARDPKVQYNPTKLHNLFEEYTRLVDELQDNLDSYDETHSDVRKALKELVPASEKWLVVLNKPPADQSYDFSRKTALEAGQSLVTQTKKLQADQIKWFAEHKKDKDSDSPPPPPK